MCVLYISEDVCACMCVLYICKDVCACMCVLYICEDVCAYMYAVWVGGINAMLTPVPSCAVLRSLVSAQCRHDASDQRTRCCI